MTRPATLDRAGIAARIPHAGAMCLLDRLLGWSAGEVRCRAVGHADPAHPLRHGGALPATAAVEYAAQAIALHGALVAATATATPGVLVAARGVRLHVARLDDIAGALVVGATRLAGDPGRAIYRFAVADETGRSLVDGRLTVVFGETSA